MAKSNKPSRKKNARTTTTTTAKKVASNPNDWFAYDAGGLMKFHIGPFKSAGAAKKYLRERRQDSGPFRQDGQGGWVGNNFVIYPGPARQGKEILAPTAMVNPRSDEVDERAATELELWIDNTYELYQRKRAVEMNLAKHMRKGRYDSSRAADGFMYVVDEGARHYTKEFGSPGDRIDVIFNKPTRRRVAQEFARGFEAEYALHPDSYRESNPGRHYDADEWPEFVLAGVIESEGLPRETPTRLTSELKNALDEYEYRLQEAIEDIVLKYPPKLGQGTKAVWEAEAPYAAFATLNGEGVGISDGRWNHLWSDQDLEGVQRMLKSSLGDAVDWTGGGWLNEAFRVAAHNNAAGRDRDDNPAPSETDRAQRLAARLAGGLS